MTPEHFAEGIRYLEIASGITLASDRKPLYYERLQDIPNALWDSGIVRVGDTHRSFSVFPLIAEIGEACVPGQAETENMDKWSGRWTKTLTPWPERLARLLTPALPPPTPPLQIPGPRAPLSENEWMLLGKPNFKKLLMSLEEKISERTR